MITRKQYNRQHDANLLPSDSVLHEHFSEHSAVCAFCRQSIEHLWGDHDIFVLAYRVRERYREYYDAMEASNNARTRLDDSGLQVRDGDFKALRDFEHYAQRHYNDRFIDTDIDDVGLEKVDRAMSYEGAEMSVDTKTALYDIAKVKLECAKEEISIRNSGNIEEYYVNEHVTITDTYIAIQRDRNEHISGQDVYAIRDISSIEEVIDTKTERMMGIVTIIIGVFVLLGSLGSQAQGRQSLLGSIGVLLALVLLYFGFKWSQTKESIIDILIYKKDGRKESLRLPHWGEENRKIGNAIISVLAVRQNAVIQEYGNAQSAFTVHPLQDTGTVSPQLGELGPVLVTLVEGNLEYDVYWNHLAMRRKGSRGIEEQFLYETNLQAALAQDLIFTDVDEVTGIRVFMDRVEIDYRGKALDMPERTIIRAQDILSVTTEGIVSQLCIRTKDGKQTKYLFFSTVAQDACKAILSIMRKSTSY